jgi:hypothetical protein
MDWAADGQGECPVNSCKLVLVSSRHALGGSRTFRNCLGNGGNMISMRRRERGSNIMTDWKSQIIDQI